MLTQATNLMRQALRPTQLLPQLLFLLQHLLLFLWSQTHQTLRTTTERPLHKLSPNRTPRP